MALALALALALPLLADYEFSALFVVGVVGVVGAVWC